MDWVARGVSVDRYGMDKAQSVARYFTALLFFDCCVIGCFAFRAQKNPIC